METLTFDQTDQGLQNRQTETWTFKRGIGYAPVQALVSAAAVCESYVYQEILTNSKIPYTFQKTTVSYDRDPDGNVNPVQAMTITFYVTIPEAKQGLAQRALRLVAANCPVTQSLDPKIKITEQLVLV
ncbi:OsmC family protein [Lapidilactobacillus achengensis]|uniref:OsmC family protein n=1 Tax=Lapidilactobacillus achengensis TaxID=2486000 RepID=A0ABW1UKE6_9LACO|nr:OsmC family protein [Lapidilactobacillus achengensis]